MDLTRRKKNDINEDDEKVIRSSATSWDSFEENPNPRRGQQQAQDVADEQDATTLPPRKYWSKIFASPEDDNVEECPEADIERINVPQDTFSFFAVGNLCTLPCLLSIFVFCLQLVIYALTITNLLENSNPNNPFKIPVYVDRKVQAAQVLAIFITAATLIPDATSTAIMTAVTINQLTLPSRFKERGLRKGMYSTSRLKLYLTVFMRFIESLSAAATSFLLIVQSTVIIELFFNFAALTFVSSLDNLAFVTARDGFLGTSSSVVEMARTVANSEVRISQKRMHRKLWFGRIFILAIFVAMMSLWAVVYSRQEKGFYDCHSLSIQFGDESISACGLMSGVFVFTKRHPITRYPIYSNSRTGADLTHTATMKAWSVKGWFCTVYSSEMKDYDIMKVSESVSWNVWDSWDDTHGYPLDYISLTCNDCDRQEDAVDSTGNDYQSVCSGRGECSKESNKECVCKPDEDEYESAGPMCEIWSPAQWCEFLVTNTYEDEHKYDPSPSGSGQYIILRQPDQKESEYLEFYGRPVYFGYTQDTYGKIILYTGRRYILGNTSQILNIPLLNVTRWNDVIDVLGDPNTSPEELFWGPRVSDWHSNDDDGLKIIQQLRKYGKERFDGVELVSDPEKKDGVASLMWYEPIREKTSTGNLGISPDPAAERGDRRLHCVPRCTDHFDDDEWFSNSCDFEQSNVTYEDVREKLASEELPWYHGNNIFESVSKAAILASVEGGV